MVLGHTDYKEYFEKYSGLISPAQALYLLGNPREHPKVSWLEFIDEENYETATDLAVDLLDKMLVIDHAKRITPKDAMAHPYFNKVRK